MYCDTVKIETCDTAGKDFEEFLEALETGVHPEGLSVTKIKIQSINQSVNQSINQSIIITIIIIIVYLYHICPMTNS